MVDNLTFISRLYIIIMDDSFGFNSLNQTVIDMEEVRELNFQNSKFTNINQSWTYKISWIHEFESFCVLQNLSDNPRKIATFHLHLKGPALVWFNAMDLTHKLSWAVLKDAFQNLSQPNTGKGIKVGKTRAGSDRKIYKRTSRPISIFCSGSEFSKPPERFPTGQITRSLWVPSVLESYFRRRDSASFFHGINT